MQTEPTTTPNLEAPEPVTAAPSRIPHLGHALLFLAIAILCLILTQGILFALHLGTRHAQPTPLNIDTRLLLASQAVAYLLTLSASAAIFPRLWHVPFLAGIEWRWPDARRQALRLIPAGLVLAFAAQAALVHFKPPNDLPIEQIFTSASAAWLATVFGTLIAPVFEEIAFRGFLFPALAIAYDWLALPRTPEAHARWQATTGLTPAALLFSAILSSLGFALLHGQQLDFLLPTLAVLFSVSLALTYIRARTRSVACSALVHAAYNGSVFLAAILQTHGYRHLDKLAK